GGSGLVVRAARRPPADRRRRAAGAAGMSLQTYGWLVLAFPLGGAILISLLFKVLPGRLAGALGTVAIALSCASAVGPFAQRQSLGEDSKQVVSVGWDYAVTSGVDAQ